MLGGKANPTGQVAYSVANDDWTDLAPLPFSVVNGGCTTFKAPDDCFTYGKMRDEGNALATVANVDTADDCQLLCQVIQNPS